jgi:hypothetical protein
MKCMAKPIEGRFESIEQLASEINALRVDYPWSVEEARAWWSKHGDG